MIKVLHIVSGLGNGGVESMLYNYYQQMDRTKIHFDFIVHGNDGLFAEKFRELGSTIYNVTPKKESILRNIRDFYRYIDASEYDIVHSHIGEESFIPLTIAMLKGAKIRIAGAHCSIKLNLFHRAMRLLTKFTANGYCACSEMSAETTFGKLKDGLLQILPNAICAEKFTYNEAMRATIREQYAISNETILLGNIGRLVWEKNQKFLIDLIGKINADSQKKYHLMLVGAGSLETSLKEYAHACNCGDFITFVEPQANIQDYYNAFDCFLFPSINEGFGIVAIEAQACGLPVIASDTLSSELQLSDRFMWLPIGDASVWVNELRKLDLQGEERTSNSVLGTKYDITYQTIELSRYYTDLIKKGG